MRTTRSRAARRAVGAAVTAVCLAVSLSACTGDGGDSSSSSGDGPGGDEAADEPAPLETTAGLGKVSGQLPKAKRSKVRQQVAHAVDAWFDAAYVGGDYPRTDFTSSWPGFTTGAKEDAEDDKSLMSNFNIGRVVSSVEAITRKVSVDVLAVRGHARGATARFVLRFRTVGDVKDDDVQHKVEVRGRLFLTPSPEGWRIFGYDVTKGAVA